MSRDAEFTGVVLVPKAEARVACPRPHETISLDVDVTPRRFVVAVLRAVFRVTVDEASGPMPTARRKGSRVVAAITKRAAEENTARATEAGRRRGHPLAILTERGT